MAKKAADAVLRTARTTIFCLAVPLLIVFVTTTQIIRLTTGAAKYLLSDTRDRKD